jgi:polyisoprenoid-binding protein YceI
MTIYKIDPSHTSINFSVKHMMIAKVRGDFNKFTGTFQFDPEQPETSHVVVEIEVSSINTRDTQRDTHLRSADFFDVGQFPHITFNSKKIVAQKDALKVTGDLTIHGITNSVTIDVEGPSKEHKDPWGNFKIGLSGTTKIKRKEFGLTWNAALEAGGFLVGDDVNISIDVQLVKQPQ